MQLLQAQHSERDELERMSVTGSSKLSYLTALCVPVSKTTVIAPGATKAKMQRETTRREKKRRRKQRGGGGGQYKERQTDRGSVRK